VSGGLVILHVDGLSHAALLEAFGRGEMKAGKDLVDAEGYSAIEYRSGLPSTTPYVQAGLLYGDNLEIPGFRWWDRLAGTVIGFGARGTFKQVAHRYFRGARALCSNGACIAACYPAGAAETFGLTYRDRSHEIPGEDRGARDVLKAWAANPAHLADMLATGLTTVATTTAAGVRARVRGKKPGRTYLAGDILEEVFLHHQSRYATGEAMDRGYPVIYAAFYAYDETGHALGITDGQTRRMLRHVDDTIRHVADRRVANKSGRRYELIVLSDHGQVETAPLRQIAGASLGELLARHYPGSRIEEHNGKTYGPLRSAEERLVVCNSGGLSHLYLAASPERLDAAGIKRRLPDLVDVAAALPGVGFAVLRDGRHDVAVTSDGRFQFAAADPGDAKALFAGYDDPALVAAQLARLNSFANSGDVILVARWDAADRRQVNFEEQLGGHGSLGGDQGRPFLLAKREWGLAGVATHDASQLHPALWELRRRLTGER
jgi:hypothetical protein